MEGTAKFVNYVTRMWNILNTKSCDIAVRLNDPDRQKFTDPNDYRLDFLLKMATMFKSMDNSVHGKRVKGLTSEKDNALHRTLVGIVDLIRTLIKGRLTFCLEKCRVTEFRDRSVYADSLVVGIIWFPPNKFSAVWNYNGSNSFQNWVFMLKTAMSLMIVVRSVWRTVSPILN